MLKSFLTLNAGLFTVAAYRAKLSELARRVGWVGHCLRQLDHVAAQRVRRTHQWLVFNNRLWPGKCYEAYYGNWPGPEQKIVFDTFTFKLISG
jgi:hypothetical protein